MKYIQTHGRDHEKKGVYQSYVIDKHLAMAISAGATPKLYNSVDVNEDSVYIASQFNGDLRLAAVADGHRGEHSARIAIDELSEWWDCIPSIDELTLRKFQQWLIESLWEIHRKIVDSNKELEEINQSRTTLSLAVSTFETIYWGNFGLVILSLLLNLDINLDFTT